MAVKVIYIIKSLFTVIMGTTNLLGEETHWNGDVAKEYV